GSCSEAYISSSLLSILADPRMDRFGLLLEVVSFPFVVPYSLPLFPGLLGEYWTFFRVLLLPSGSICLLYSPV
ncbi:877_t:CDS:1, partial [Acaulospora morrowiae]